MLSICRGRAADLLQEREQNSSAQKALVRSIKAMYNGICCSRHFSCSWRTEKIISTVDLSALSPRSKYLPTLLSSDIPLQLLQSLRSPLFLYNVMSLASRISWGSLPSLQHVHSGACNGFSRAGFPHLMISGGMPSSPGAFPLDSASMALLSSSIVGSASSSSRRGRSSIVSNAS